MRVRRILDDVRRRGDRAVLDYTAKWDKAKLKSLLVTKQEFTRAERSVPVEERRVLEQVAERFRRFYEAQKMRSVPVVDKTGFYSERVAPIDRVGLYVPGGRAPLVSTMLMLGIPAQVAGVPERYAATPPQRDGSILPHMLVAAKLSDVTAVYKMGGAQAIGAFAFGTKTVRRVDKIFGPGNTYVTTAKSLVFGLVGIDTLAGPSELVVIADDSADAELVAEDLLAQAEHGEDSQAILLTTSRRIECEVKEIVSTETHLKKQIHVFLARSLKTCVEAAADQAPEHLSLAVQEPEKLLPDIGPAGAIFLGSTAVAHGDYVAGPNHTLPTAGAARFSSALSIEAFYRRSSIVNVRDPDGELSRLGAVMAEIEGLSHHSRSLRLRARGK